MEKKGGNHTEFLSVDGGGLYKISAFEGRRLGFLEFRTEANTLPLGHIKM